MSSTIFLPEASSDASIDANLFLSNNCRIYSQPLFKEMAQVGVEIAFHPSEQAPLQFYAECNQEVLSHLTHTQLRTISRVIKAHSSRPARLFYKVESRVLFDLVPAIIEVARQLQEEKVELIIDVHERLLLSSNRVADAVIKLKENGVFSCLGGYEWEQEDTRSGQISAGLYQYVRLANPPRYLNDTARFFDICFKFAEELGISIIVDKVQSRSQYEYTRKAPCFAVKGFYLEKPNLLNVAGQD